MENGERSTIQPIYAHGNYIANYTLSTKNLREHPISRAGKKKISSLLQRGIVLLSYIILFIYLSISKHYILIMTHKRRHSRERSRSRSQSSTQQHNEGRLETRKRFNNEEGHLSSHRSGTYHHHEGNENKHQHHEGHRHKKPRRHYSSVCSPSIQFDYICILSWKCANI